jgi:dihydrofolate synthase/folylpolyglutamate synthase
MTLPDYPAALRYLTRELPDWETAPPGAGPRQDVVRPAALFTRLGLLPPPFPTVLVAGTNGKGSTAAFLESILRAAGHCVGLYTQPHLHTYRERIQVDRQLIPEAEFAARVTRVQAAIAALAAEAPDLGAVTSYEAATALALLHFAETPVDVAVLEVGLGGRLDATNAVAAPVAVLAPIALDHTAILGDTLAAIAAEKADIVKPGAIAITAPQDPAALAVVQQVAAARGADLRLVTDGASPPAGGANAWAARREGASIVGRRATYANLQLGLRGEHQWGNATLAVAAAEALAERGLAVSPAAVAAGLASTHWPGRLELVQAGPPPILVDGAHNPAGAATLAAALARDYPTARRLLVLGTSADKDLAGILAALAPVVDRVYATEAHHPRALPRERVLRAARALGLRGQSIPTVGAAIRHAVLQRGPDDVICIAGSLYVVAEARAALGHAAAVDPPV